MCLAVPGKIIKIVGKNADIDFGGVVRSARLDFLTKPRVGEYVIVHAGFAIQKLDKKDALETVKLIKEAFGSTRSLI